MDLKVFITTRESVCDECGAQLGHHAWNDELLARELERSFARREVADEIEHAMERWK